MQPPAGLLLVGVSAAGCAVVRHSPDQSIHLLSQAWSEGLE